MPDLDLELAIDVLQSLAMLKYCVAILYLREDGALVRQAHLARWFGFTTATVAQMTKKLEEHGLVRRDRGLVLTPQGQGAAQRIVRRHRLAERFLVDVLKLPWPQAHHEADSWQHAISPEVEAALDRVLQHPTTCPHGNPIPGSNYKPPNTRPLASLRVGQEFTIMRIRHSSSMHQASSTFSSRPPCPPVEPDA